MSKLQWRVKDADEPGVAYLGLPLIGDLEQSLLRGQPPQAPLRASVTKPGRFTDLLGLGWPSIYALSPRFASAIAGLAGVLLTPIEIEGGPAGYRFLGVTGRCGSVDNARSVEVGGIGRFIKLRGLYVDEPTDHVDFAVPANAEVILISTRAADLIRTAKFENVELIALDKVEFFP